MQGRGRKCCLAASIPPIAALVRAGVCKVLRQGWSRAPGLEGLDGVGALAPVVAAPRGELDLVGAQAGVARVACTAHGAARVDGPRMEQAQMGDGTGAIAGTAGRACGSHLQGRSVAFAQITPPCKQHPSIRLGGACAARARPCGCAPLPPTPRPCRPPLFFSRDDAFQTSALVLRVNPGLSWPRVAHEKFQVVPLLVSEQPVRGNSTNCTQ